jgi:hypothetical protein
MAAIDKVLQWGIKTVFLGEHEVDDTFNAWDKKTKTMVPKPKTKSQISETFTLEKRVGFSFPDWGRDSTMDMSVTLERGGKTVYVQGSLFSGGFYSLDTKTMKLEVHN